MHVVVSPLEFIGRLAALVPKPRVNLTRFHGVFSSNSKLRKQVVPQPPAEREQRQKHKAYSMTWAQRLKRVFAIEIEKCEKCGGPVRIIAAIEDPDLTSMLGGVVCGPRRQIHRRLFTSQPTPHTA